MKSITIGYLRKILRYEPDTGKLYWLTRPASLFQSAGRCNNWNSRWAGKEAFTAESDGRRVGNLKGTILKAHRVAWALHYGQWPNGEIDHINGDPSDNRIENLRDVPRHVNARNMPLRCDNTSGATGVARHGANKWIARLGTKHIGVFGSFEDALSARHAAAAANQYHENHGRAQ